MASVKKAIKIYARLKPSDNDCVSQSSANLLSYIYFHSESKNLINLINFQQFDIDKHINDDGSTDDVLILNPTAAMNALNSNYQENECDRSLNKDAYKFR